VNNGPVEIRWSVRRECARLEELKHSVKIGVRVSSHTVVPLSVLLLLGPWNSHLMLNVFVEHVFAVFGTPVVPKIWYANTLWVRKMFEGVCGKI
jgi:hypothetical protein